jgi:tetratricopeptide (TPR) repeat protein
LVNFEMEVEIKEFFISRCGADRAWAKWIAWHLEEAGYTTIVQDWDFVAGRNFVREMDEASKKAKRTIALISPDYFESGFTLSEWAATFKKDPTGEKGLLVPVIVRECDPEGLLGQIVYIDLVGLKEDDAKEALLDGVKQERAKPQMEPAYPGALEPIMDRKPPFPGALPSVWNVPYNKNRNFTGRSSLLSNLRAALTSAQIVALHGLGGMGKTQLAIEYIHRHKTDYKIVWWIRSEEPSTLSLDYADLARDLNLPHFEDPREVTKAVRRCLGQNKDWLLIFDNAEDPAAIREYLPQGDAGHVIITTRDSTDWGSIATPLPVRKFERKEAIEFLLSRTGQNDDVTANALAEALGDLPLALEQAGAYIVMTRRSLADYLKLFKERQTELLKRGKPIDYPDTVATAWDISFQKVQEKSPEAADLLNLCAFLAPDDIPKSLLSQGVQHLPESMASVVAEDVKLDDAIIVLQSYSLVDANAYSISVHRLVQTVTRDRLGKEDQKKWAGVAVRLMFGIFPAESDNVRTWDECSLLLPHALATAKYAEELEISLEETCKLLNKLGPYLNERAKFDEAKSVLEKALVIKIKVYGPDHSEVAKTLNNLGIVLRHIGYFKAARKYLERALEIYEKNLPYNHHPEVTPTLDNLATVLADMEDLDGAEEYLERSLKIELNAYGPDDLRVSKTLENLGNVLRLKYDLNKSREYLERALEIYEKRLPPDHPDVAPTLGNLGAVLQTQGDLAGARKMYEKALMIYEKAFGPDDPSISATLGNLGIILRDQWDLEGAREHLERALKIKEKIYGPDHVDVAGALNNLGLVLKDQGDFEGAKKMYEKALEIYEKKLPPDHPNVAGALNNLGLVLKDQGDLEGAKKMYEKALEIYEKKSPPDHPDIARTLRNLGIVLHDRGELENAKRKYEKALEIYEKKLPPDHPDVARALASLGSVLHDQGDLEGAKRKYEKALEIYEKKFPLGHPEMSGILNNLGLISQAKNDFVGAKRYYEKALNIAENTLGPDNPNVAIITNNIGVVLYKIIRNF